MELKSVDKIIHAAFKKESLYETRINIKYGRLTLNGKLHCNPDFVPLKFPLEIEYCRMKLTQDA